jgi:hypothetical protein
VFADLVPWGMHFLEENWKVLTSFFPTGWQQMAWQSGAVERLRGFSSPDVLLRMLMVQVARATLCGRWLCALSWRAQPGHVPEHDDRSSRAWLYGKLLVNASGTEIDSHRARYFPLGLPTLGAGGHIVRRVNSVSRFTRSSRLSNRTSSFQQTDFRAEPWPRSRP